MKFLYWQGSRLQWYKAIQQLLAPLEILKVDCKKSLVFQFLDEKQNVHQNQLKTEIGPEISLSKISQNISFACIHVLVTRNYVDLPLSIKFWHGLNLWLYQASRVMALSKAQGLPSDTGFVYGCFLFSVKDGNFLIPSSKGWGRLHGWQTSACPCTSWDDSWW